jgi:hypothetical protein
MTETSKLSPCARGFAGLRAPFIYEGASRAG